MRKITLYYSILILVAVLCLFLIVWGSRQYLRRSPDVPLPPRTEIDITIIPGWNLRQIANDWMKHGLIQNENELYILTGEPAKDYQLTGLKAPQLQWTTTGTLRVLFQEKSPVVSYEGYFLPETYRVYADATPEEIIKKIFSILDKRITPEMRALAESQQKSWFEILTMASVVEREASTEIDMRKVADIFWRREKIGWALQSCATVNYITGKSDPAVSAADKQINSLFNTYQYPGLPLGPIGNPSMRAIMAVLAPEKNDYWYFMSDLSGQMHYAKTLTEHNNNVTRYLR